MPAGMVVITVSTWYVGDVVYNDYESYRILIGDESLESAWWQVLWFVVAFGVLVPQVHHMVNGRLERTRSHVTDYLESNRLRRANVQHQINLIGGALLSIWLVLMGIALFRLGGNVFGLFAPYLGQRADPWARGQIGGGFSALISVGGYLQIFLAAAFGVLTAVSYNPKTRSMAITVCCLALPYYIFDRTRNTMLATVLPGVLTYVAFRIRGGFIVKGAVLAGCFLVVHLWFSFVITNRSDMAIAEAFKSRGNKDAVADTKHLGLNMLEELAWLDRYIETGTYLPATGQRYFAELVNPIPRGLWKDKPMIGLDYALARGQLVTGEKGEMTATISTGMIGQGVANFGRFFGPLAAAFLMALWVAMLARQDLLGDDPGRLLLYACGLILTFNLGRDITLLVLYPFFFGLILLKMYHSHVGNQRGALS